MRRSCSFAAWESGEERSMFHQWNMEQDCRVCVRVCVRSLCRCVCQPEGGGKGEVCVPLFGRKQRSPVFVNSNLIVLSNG